jgi:hypothetical protein
MGSQLGKLVGVDFAVQLIGWMISAKFGTEKFFDLTGRRIYIDSIYSIHCIFRFFNVCFIDLFKSK